MRTYTWNCPCCRATYNTRNPPGVWACRFCGTIFKEPPAFTIDGGDE